MTSYHLFCGIDIAACSASVAIQPASTHDKIIHFEIQQDDKGYRKLHHKLQASGVQPDQIFIIMEATGTYWIQLASYLSSHAYQISVVNPASAFHFARSLLKYEKTDAMDARVLATMGSILHSQLPLWREPPAIYEPIYQCLTQRDALVRMKTQLKNQDHARAQRKMTLESVGQRTTELRTLLKKQIYDCERELTRLYKRDHHWSDSAQRLLSIKGVGVVTTGWLLVATQNFQCFDTPEQAASFAGLVPRQRQSGTSLRGKAQIGNACHARLRHVLFVATKSAIQHNPHIKPFYERLKDNGKVSKVATIAAARKLLHICWACVKHECMYDPDHGRM